ncbi:hypothetical protein ANANG_G00057840 [Anguilla anguilla]|uniref:Uncharacterized protein n=1 Tax=Anguilla anguilla TaxID=7936 RepID=A0A9D3MN63_ANGAN|nr:hypothetical protein ANANG_G00057840 [Anguilla anguilla]
MQMNPLPARQRHTLIDKGFTDTSLRVAGEPPGCACAAASRIPQAWRAPLVWLQHCHSSDGLLASESGPWERARNRRCPPSHKVPGPHSPASCWGLMSFMVWKTRKESSVPTT